MTKDDEAGVSAADRAEMLTKLEPELASGELVKRVAKSAWKRVDRLRRAGIPVSERTAEELTHDALLLTIEGRRPWNGSYPLGAHLSAIVRSLTLDMLRDQRKRRHVALRSELKWGDTNDGDCERAADLARRGAKPTERANRVVSVRDAAARILHAIRTNLHDDAAALSVAAAWERGETARADGIETSGLAPAAYDAAVKRILRMMKALPDEVRTSTEDAMEMSHGG